MTHYYIWSIGCQMNDAESRRAAEGLEALGYLPAAQAEDADVILLNSCVVRQSAEDKAWGRLASLRPVKKKHPETVIALMGCLVGQEPSRLANQLPYVDLFLPPAQVEGLFAYLLSRNGDPGKALSREGLEQRWALQDEEGPVPALLSQPVSTYVSVIHGCDHRCTFCIIPFRRGPQRSRPIPEVVAEVKSLVDRGVKEVTLLGQIVDAYGHDLPDQPDLADLLAAVHRVEGLDRIRFLTSHPIHMSERIINAVADLPKICPHIELPVQAGDDAVLKRMARGYKVDAYRQLLDMIRDKVPGVSIATDVIVGFCGETEEQFMGTYQIVEEERFDVVHIASYSPRPGTYSATHMADDVPPEEKERRRMALEELHEKISAEKNAALLGQTVEVLVEEKHQGKWKGRTRTNKLVFFEDTEDWQGKLAQVQITWTGPWSMQGQVVRRN